MAPTTSVFLAWLLFAGTHVGLASGPIRGRLVARLGEQAFQSLFSLVATVTFTVLVTTYAGVADAGPFGPALGRYPLLRTVLVVLSTFGVVCVFGSLLDYPTSAYALSSAGRKREPRGFERITRHGFAVGIALVGLAHALLASRLTGTVFFGMLALFGILGSVHQDTKLAARHPREHGEYLARTSLLPFVAILQGRTAFVATELRPVALALGLLAAWALRQAHPSIFAHGGAYVVGVALLGAAAASFQDYRRARSQALRTSKP